MSDAFLLDTNAYFNFLKYTSAPSCSGMVCSQVIERIRAGTCYISVLSQIEIISVIGKYARGCVGGYEKCNCIISEAGDRCGHSKYKETIKRMKPSAIKQWLKLVDDTISGKSQVITVSVLPFSQTTISEAQKIIKSALVHNFGSLDAMIAATAKEYFICEQARNIILVTSDKGLKACLEKQKIPYWDAFSVG